MQIRENEEKLLKYIREKQPNYRFLMFLKGLDYKVIRQAKKESSLLIYNTRYESHIDDMSFGLFQLLSGTIEGLGFDENKEDIFNTETQVQYAMKYLNFLFGKFAEVHNIEERLTLAFASYNCGRGNINKAIAKLMEKENITYQGRDTTQGEWSDYSRINEELIGIIGEKNANINKRYINYIMKGE